MRQRIATVLVLLAIFAMANVVCAGVMRVLADIAMGFGALEHYTLWLSLCAISVSSALAFIFGAIPAGIKFLKWIG